MRGQGLGKTDARMRDLPAHAVMPDGIMEPMKATRPLPLHAASGWRLAAIET